jgi:hypothetical protein
MPKRLIDGEALWRSNKLNQVQPLSFRAEYSNLIPLAEADGTFEADVRRVWANVYSYNRPDVTVDMVAEILDEFERVGMLVRKGDEKGKVWGIFVGMESRLPAKSQRDKYKQGNAKIFKDIVKSYESINVMHPNSRPNLDKVQTGLVRFGIGLGLDRKGLEQPLSKEEIARQCAIDDEKNRRDNEEHEKKKEDEARIAALCAGELF